MSKDYRIRECLGCGYSTDCREYELRGRGPTALCDICANTPNGSAIEFPDQHPRQEQHILRTICWIGNLLLDATGRRERAFEVLRENQREERT